MLRIMIVSRRLHIILFMEKQGIYPSSGHSDVEYTHTSMKTAEKKASTFLGR